MTRNTLLVSALLGVGACGGSRDSDHSVSEAPHWSYAGDTGPARWASLDSSFAACASGQRQSPINLEKFSDVELSPLALSYAADGDQVIHNGHTIQVQVKPGSTLRVGNQAYELKQFHFHAPSENQIEGKAFPLEAHFVHADSAGTLAVVGVMFEEGARSQALDTLLKQAPTAAGPALALTTPASPAALLPPAHDYYHFAGSLTTPPCSEGVRWLVLKRPATASGEQIAQISKAMGHANNRPIQPLNGRTVEQ